MRMCHFQAQNSSICPDQKNFGTNHYYYFHLPTGPFHCTKFKKISTVDSELWGCAIFGLKMVHLPQTNFFWKIINIILIYLLAPFICKILKNSSSGSRVMRMHNFWAQNGSFPQMRIFFRKPVNELCSLYSCLSTCQKPKSDINLLVKH